MKAPLKMIVSDLDGTLLKNHLEITDFTVEVIKKARAKGILFVVATGRPMQTIKKYVNAYDFIDYYIVSNGMAVYNPKNTSFIISNTFSKEDLLKILEVTEKEVANYDIHAHEGLYYHGPLRKTYFDHIKTLHHHEDAPSAFPLEELEDLHALSVTKIMWIEEDIPRYEALMKIAQNLGDYQIVRSQTSYIDFNLKGISKGKTLKDLADSLNIKKEEIIAFGDQNNDLTMIKYAGIGVAMENATAELKEVADAMTKSSEDDGVAYYLKQILDLND